jgi:hypothetical protein
MLESGDRSCARIGANKLSVRITPAINPVQTRIFFINEPPKNEKGEKNGKKSMFVSRKKIEPFPFNFLFFY